MRQYQLCIALILITVFTPLTEAQDTTEQNPHLMHPQLLGRGGTFAGADTGFLAATTNPANIALTPGEVTFFSTNAWLHTNIASLFPAFGVLLGDNSPQGRQALGRALSTNGMGFGSALGAGYYGDRLGVGLNIATDFLFFGNSFPNQIVGTITTDVRLIIALAYSIESEVVKLAIGASAEPFYRMHTSFSESQSADIIRRYLNIETANSTSFLNSENTLYGSGVAFHAGILFELLAQLTIGLTFRDIGDTRIDYSRTTLAELINTLTQVRLPQPASRGAAGFIELGEFSILSDVRFGLSYHPQFDVGLILAPRFSIEIGNVNLLISQPEGYNILHSTHLGLELGIDDTVIIQAGLNQAQLTFGTGLKTEIFEIHGAWFGAIHNETTKYFSSHGLIVGIRFKN